MTDATKRITVTGRVKYNDNAAQRHGTEDDFEVRYNDTDDRIEIEHLGSGDVTALAGNVQNLPVLSSAPSSPQTGDIALQDGSNWDPTASGAQELVTYNGTSWVSA